MKNVYLCPLLMTLADNQPINNICIALVLFVMLLHRTE